MSTKSYRAIAAEAAEYGITIKENGFGYLQFLSPQGEVIADMTPTMGSERERGEWFGSTTCPKVTGYKYGTKAKVANWCLDWAANGF